MQRPPVNTVFILTTQQTGPPVFQRVCNRCSSVPNSVADGVLGHSTWLLPFCENQPTGTVPMSNGTTTDTLVLDKGYYRDSQLSEDVLKCYRPESCKGGDDATDYCAMGYEGACKGIVLRVDTCTTVH